uniref:Chemoreceptor zinc-binding domain-containing protein n=1 Tax=mine drainage metagenome TaxID=410659 RepID=E6QR56_9ZZZZ
MPAHEFPGWSATWRPDPIWSNRPVVSRDNLPLLFAGVEHRAWIADIENFLRGERETPPPLAHHQCRFGMWLDSSHHAMQPAFQAIETLHQQVHALALDLLELHAQGRTTEALARLRELHGLRDSMLEQLKGCVAQSLMVTLVLASNDQAPDEEQTIMTADSCPHHQANGTDRNPCVMIT